MMDEWKSLNVYLWRYTQLRRIQIFPQKRERLQTTTGELLSPGRWCRRRGGGLGLTIFPLLKYHLRFVCNKIMYYVYCQNYHE